MKLPRNILDDIMTQARAEAPLEACGLLAGEEGNGGGTVQCRYALRNADASAEHFSLDPREHLAAVKAARAAGWRILAVYHSHPSSPAHPSAEDIRLAFDPQILYLIVSLADPARPARLFRIVRGQVEEQTLAISEPSLPDFS